MIRVEVTYTAPDYVRVMRFMARRQTVIFNSMLGLGAVILALLLYRENPDGFNWWAIPAIIGLLLLFVFFIRFLQRRGVSKQLKGAPAANEPYVFTFTDDGISIAGRLSKKETADKEYKLYSRTFVLSLSYRIGK